MTAPHHRLSYGARGLYQAISDLDADQDSLTPELLVTEKNRVTSVRNLLQELEDEGFLRRWREGAAREESGRLAGGGRMAWALYPSGEAPNQS